MNKVTVVIQRIRSRKGTWYFSSETRIFAFTPQQLLPVEGKNIWKVRQWLHKFGYQIESIIEHRNG